MKKEKPEEKPVDVIILEQEAEKLGKAYDVGDRPPPSRKVSPKGKPKGASPRNRAKNHVLDEEAEKLGRVKFRLIEDTKDR